MLFMVLLHVSYVTATETKTKREAKLFPKYAFDINPAFTSVRSTNQIMPHHLLNPKKWGQKKDGGTRENCQFSQSKLTDQKLTFIKTLKQIRST
jgi:hypothetical protein